MLGGGIRITVGLIFGFAVFALVNLVVVLAARIVVARLIGLHGAGVSPIFPAYSSKERGKPAVAWWRQLLLVLGGLAAAYGLAGCLFGAGLKMGGHYEQNSNGELATVIAVIQGQPAEAAGLRDGDRIVAVAGVAVNEWSEMARHIRQHPNKTISVVVEREARQQRFNVAVGENRRIGVRPGRVPVGIAEAIILGIQKPVQVCRDLIVGLRSLLAGSVDAELAGPVVIVREVGRAAKHSTSAFLNLMGVLQSYFGLISALVLAFFVRFRRYDSVGAALEGESTG